MAIPVTETVHFTLKVRSFDRGDHWATMCEQTAVFTYGATKEVAEHLNGETHIALVREVKKKGRAELKRFMEEAGFTYKLGAPNPPEQTRTVSGEGYYGELPKAA